MDHDSPSTCQAYSELVRAARRCDERLASLDQDEALLAARDEDRTAARHMLTEMAAHCRRATTVFDLDPTLAGEPWIRDVDVLVELVRQLDTMVRSVLRAPAGNGRFGRDGQGIGQMWHEAQLLMERVPVLADEILARARLDHGTVAGQHAISLRRLRGNLDAFPDVVRQLRTALTASVALEHPHPHAVAMRDLLGQLAERVAAAREQDVEAARAE